MPRELSPEARALVRGRIPNYDTLSQQDQIIEAIKVIKDDFYLYTERNLMIRNKDAELVPLNFNWTQRLFIDLVLSDLAQGKPIRYIILKARQMGISTAIEALCFWWTTTHRNITSIIMAHESEASGNLYEMFRRYYDNAHPFFQPTRKYNTQKSLVFDIEDTEKEKLRAEGVEKMPGLGSQIRTMVAKEGKGRSFTGSFFHGSEVAFWEDGADVVASAFQAIPYRPNTFILLESTANGVGGYFYDTWQMAKQGKSTLKPLFFAWHEHAEYELDTEPLSGTYDEEELELLAIFGDKGYPRESWDRKIAWRREKKKEFIANPEEFYQEYPKDDVEAFLSSGRPVFDRKMLLKMEQLANQSPEPQFGEVVEVKNTETNKTSYDFFPTPRVHSDLDPAPLKVWELPQKGVKYSIAIDSSEGKIVENASRKENDYSVIDVMRIDNLKTVARWRGHIDPDLLGDVAYDLGMFYNQALIAPEINNHGMTVVATLRNRFYRNLYVRQSSEENPLQERLGKYGFKTDRRSKPHIINKLATAIRQGDILDLDPVFIRECMTYIREDDGKMNAQPGMFDDTVMAKAINLFIAGFDGLSVEYAKENIQKPITKSYGTDDREFYGYNGTSSSDRRFRNARSPEAVQRRKAARAAHRSKGR